MPSHVVDLVVHALNDQTRSVRGSQILVLGAAYKPNISDYRESPSLEIIEMLHHQGAEVSYSDPHVPSLEVGDMSLISVELTDDVVSGADCVLIVTHHSLFDFEAIIRNAKCVVDTRNVTRKFSGSEKIYFL